MIEPSHPRISLARQCELIGFPRPGYYRKPAKETEETLRIMKRIDEIYTKYPFFGSRKIRDFMKRGGTKINRE